jgi:hypothetical protein
MPEKGARLVACDVKLAVHSWSFVHRIDASLLLIPKLPTSGFENDSCCKTRLYARSLSILINLSKNLFSLYNMAIMISELGV